MIILWSSIYLCDTTSSFFYIRTIWTLQKRPLIVPPLSNTFGNNLRWRTTRIFTISLAMSWHPVVVAICCLSWTTSPISSLVPAWLAIAQPRPYRASSKSPSWLWWATSTTCPRQPVSRLTNSQQNIVYVVHMVSQFVATYRTTHCSVVVWILCYLRSSQPHDYCFTMSPPFSFEHTMMQNLQVKWHTIAFSPATMAFLMTLLSLGDPRSTAPLSRSKT